MIKGISIKPYIGLGDALQFSSLPENYFRATGEKLVDVSRPWFFDRNPYVTRNEAILPDRIHELWNFGPKQYEWPRPRDHVYLSNAEIWASLLGVPCTLCRPRLYDFEDYPFENREMILLQTCGKFHGILPEKVIEHVIKKYKGTGRLYHIGFPDDPDVGLTKIPTPTFWDLAKVISKARMLIGPDSGPSWVAACYPDVIVKKIRVRQPDGFKPLSEWVPLEIENYHAHWDDRCAQVFNATEDDVGFTQSYRKI